MKLNILWAASLSAIMLASCSNREKYFIDEETESATGQLSTAQLLLSVTVDDNARTRAVNTDDFIVEIRKGGVLKYSYTYASMPEVITLPEGDDYTVEVKSGHEAEEAAWEAPFYTGVESFQIEANKITHVEKVVCTRDNVRVSVRFDEELKALMGSDASVVVDAGEGRSVNLVYGKEETRDGYFACNNSWNTLAARFVGTIDGHKEDFTKLYDNVRPGDHFIITYAYSTPSNPNGDGGINVEEIFIDSRVERVDRDGKVSVVEEVINDSDRPSDGVEDQPGGGDDPKPDDPVVSAPVIKGVPPIDIDKVNEVDGSSSVELVITSETGITAFTVDIISPSLTPEELKQVGLASHLDLIDPGTPELEAALKGLKFPVGSEVEGKTEVAFCITEFMPMLALVGAGEQHDFILTVTDAVGTTEKTLKLKVK